MAEITRRTFLKAGPVVLGGLGLAVTGYHLIEGSPTPEIKKPYILNLHIGEFEYPYHFQYIHRYEGPNFAIGETNESHNRFASNSDVFKQTPSGIVGPYTSVRFFSTRPDMCGYNVSESSTTITEPQPPTQKIVIPNRMPGWGDLRGLTTVFTADKAGNVTKELYVKHARGREAYKVTDGSLEITKYIPDHNILLSGGNAPGPFAVLTEEYPFKAIL